MDQDDSISILCFSLISHVQFHPFIYGTFLMKWGLQLMFLDSSKIYKKTQGFSILPFSRIRQKIKQSEELWFLSVMVLGDLALQVQYVLFDLKSRIPIATLSGEKQSCQLLDQGRAEEKSSYVLRANTQKDFRGDVIRVGAKGVCIGGY